jgi:hypothetical protein
MDDEANAKLAELVVRQKGILEELRQLKNNDDSQLNGAVTPEFGGRKLIAPLAALVLACIDLIEKLCEQSGCRGSESDKKSRHKKQDGSSVGGLVKECD